MELGLDRRLVPGPACFQVLKARRIRLDQPLCRCCGSSDVELEYETSQAKLPPSLQTDRAKFEFQVERKRSPVILDWSSDHKLIGEVEDRVVRQV